MVKPGSDLAVVEIRLASYRGQAELAYQRLTRRGDARINGIFS